ncbi:MAG TPA: hypothetical protein VIL12_07545, partial [Acidimicrobiia bacterium]
PTGCLVTAVSGVDILAAPEAGAPSVASLGAGELAYVEGRLETQAGDSWGRIPGDRWIALEGTDAGTGCEGIAVVEGPVVLRVPVTFNVELPSGTEGEVFIAGFFPDSGIPPWVPYTILLFPTTGDSRSVTVELPEGTTVEYVYTRGSFQTLERPESCGATDPRTFVVESGLTTQDTVAKWRDLDC